MDFDYIYYFCFRELGEHEALKKQNLSKLDHADESTRTLEKELEISK
jgi:hypothetical protein